MTARLLTAGLLAVLMGCGKPPAPSPPPTAPTADASDSTTGPVVTASQAVPAAGAQPDEAQIAVVLGELTQVVRRYGMEQRRAPKTLEELVAGGYLGRVPPAPAGKRFAIGKNLQVYLANQ